MHYQVVSWIKRIMNCEKTGHSGTLDPKAGHQGGHGGRSAIEMQVCKDVAHVLTSSWCC